MNKELMLSARPKTIDEHAQVLRHNNLIEAHFQLSTQEHRLLLWAIEQMQVTEGRSQIVSVDIGELARYIGLNNGDIYAEMAAVTRRMLGRRIELRNITTGDLTQANLVSAARYRKGSGKVELEISQMLLPYFLDVKTNFTLTDLHHELALSSGYAMRIYSILKSKQYRQTVVRFEIGHLQSMLGVEEKYERFNNFRERVLATACAEITRTTDISVQFEIEPHASDKRKAGAVVFRVAEKDARTAPTAAAHDQGLVARLVKAGLKDKEAAALVAEFEATDPERITFHLDLVEARVRRGDAIKSPAAFLRAGIRADWRKTETTELEREAKATEVKKYATADRLVREGAEARAEIFAHARAMQNVVARLSARDRQTVVAKVAEKIPTGIIREQWLKRPDLTSLTYGKYVREALAESGIGAGR